MARTVVTQEMIDRCYSKVKGYEKSIKSVVKEGKIYTITFNDGFGTSTVYAKITTRDLTYGYISEQRSSSIVYEQ